jgi:hypothetical protein
MTLSRKKPRRWRKNFPYFKIQLYNDVVISWMDEPRAFDTLEDAQDAIKEKYKDKKSRIIVVEEKGRRIWEAVT